MYGMGGGAGMGGGMGGYGMQMQGAGRHMQQGGQGYGGGSTGGHTTRRRETPGKVFLGGIDNNTTKESLQAYCSQWGEIVDSVVMEGRGFGFVTFADPSNAQMFLETREHMIDNKRVESKAAVPKDANGPSGLTKKMFIGGMGDTTDAEFRAYFSQFGEITDCIVLRKPDGTGRGFGFVTYADEMSVEKCLVMSHVIGGKSVELKRADNNRPQRSVAASGGGFAGGVDPRTGKAADWICPECQNKNFGWREQCNRCKVPKPQSAGMMGGGGMAAGYNNGAGYGMAGAGAGYGMAGAGMAGYGMQGMGMGMGMGGGMGGMVGGMGAGIGAGMGGMGAGMAGYGMANPAAGYGMAANGTGYGMSGMGAAGYGMQGAGMVQGAGMGAGMAGGAMGAGMGADGMGGAMGGAMGMGYGTQATGLAGYGDQQGYGRAAAGRGPGVNQRYRPY